MFAAKGLGLLKILLTYRTEFPFRSHDKNGDRGFSKILFSTRTNVTVKEVNRVQLNFLPRKTLDILEAKQPY